MRLSISVCVHKQMSVCARENTVTIVHALLLTCILRTHSKSFSQTNNTQSKYIYQYNKGAVTIVRRSWRGRCQLCLFNICETGSWR